MYPSNLFRPGDGGRPPYLAGRSRELQAVEPMAADLRATRSPSANVILYGPRGNGKTVLLNVIGDRLQQAGTAAVQVTAKGGAASLEQMLAARCAEGPLALLVDEAHMLDPKIGGGLLDASQTIRRKGAPFLLVLAGTPGIQHALQELKASHWERSRRVPVGRLDPGEDRQALMTPLEELGVAADEEALARLLEAANRYPYFLQEVGHAAVAALNRDGAQRIDAAVADRTLASFGPIKNAFYDSRVDELEDAGLLAPAVAAARAFGDADWLPRARLADALAPAARGPDAGQARRGLVARGVVWPKDGGYEPGIPSLLAHLTLIGAAGGPAPHS